MKYARKNAGNSEMFPDVGYETNKEKNLLYLENELKFKFYSEIRNMKARMQKIQKCYKKWATERTRRIFGIPKLSKSTI